MSYDELSFTEAKDQLRQWRENNERRSEEVVEIWQTVLSTYNLSKLGNEEHVVLEQVIYAALDCHQYVIASYLIYVLLKEFPGSLRVNRYTAAMLEAEGLYDKAIEVLDNIIAVDETNSPARKRRIAIMIAQGQIPEAIKELVDYLKKFMADVEAWQQLSELYLQMQEYSRAAFCMEEVILHQPHNHVMHQRLADIRYTMGGVENMELAKSYYCQALKLNPDNVRALLGLFLATNNLANHYKSSGNGSKRKEVLKLCQWAQSKVINAQKKAKAAASTPSITDLLETLAITE